MSSSLLKSSPDIFNTTYKVWISYYLVLMLPFTHTNTVNFNIYTLTEWHYYYNFTCFDRSVPCAYLCRAATNFHITNLSSCHTDAKATTLLMMPKQRWRCELKETGGVVVLTVSARWQSTGVAKARKQIQTNPNSSHHISNTQLWHVLL